MAAPTNHKGSGPQGKSGGWQGKQRVLFPGLEPGPWAPAQPALLGEERSGGSTAGQQRGPCSPGPSEGLAEVVPFSSVPFH